MAGTDLKALLKRVVELAMPDLRAYYRVPRKGRVTATYASDGRYWCDVQPLRNDESVDEREPVIPKVEIPIMWAGPMRGVVCPPLVGSFCDITYYDGDPDYPRVSNFRWHAHQAPEVEVGGYIIQREPGTHIKIDVDNQIIHVTPTNRISEIGKDTSEQIGRDKAKDVGRDETITVGANRTATTGGDDQTRTDGDRIRSTGGNEAVDVSGDATRDVGGQWTVVVSGAATIQAPTINLVGNISCSGTGGAIGQTQERAHRQHEGSYTLAGDMVITGNVTITGDLVTSGNSDAATRTGGAPE